MKEINLIYVGFKLAIDCYAQVLRIINLNRKKNS